MSSDTKNEAQCHQPTFIFTILLKVLSTVLRKVNKYSILQLERVINRGTVENREEESTVELFEVINLAKPLRKINI